MRRAFGWVSVLLVGVGTWLAVAGAATAQNWSGNFTRNPGFEEDFVHAHAEAHILSFKGDWYYNQRDLVPDFWEFKGSWTWTPAGKSGHGLQLAAGALASQSHYRAIYQDGGGAWGGGNNVKIPVADAEVARFNRPWRATVSCRGGKFTLRSGKGAATAEAPPGAWNTVVVDLPADQLGTPADSVTLTLEGPGEFDDVVVQEQLPDAPNLAANAGFELAAADGYVANWSQQKKYRAIGPTYYVWTDWNHAFRENRGAVALDPLVMRSGKSSLRFDVLPGDEKLVESDLIVLNQDQPRAIEVGVFVRADRVRLVDVRAVDQDGGYMAGVRAQQPEWNVGGSATFGNGTYEWRYVRKFFAPPRNEPVKAFRVRLCARGMNGHTLDDAGTRAYAMQVGTVWWDDLYVAERTTNAQQLAARGVKLPAAPPSAGTLGNPTLDLGQRFFGDNRLTLAFDNRGPAGSFKLRLTTTLPSGDPAAGDPAASPPVVTESPATPIAAGQRGTLVVPYRLDRLAGEFDRQGSFALELLRDGKPAGQATYRFNTWPVVVDIDVSRHYNLPEENPVSASFNLGVADATLAATKRVELQLVRLADKKVLSTQSITDLAKAFAASLEKIPKTKAESFEFKMPKPDFWADRTNLLLAQLDLSPLKVWPHDQPTRDTVVVVRGLDAAGKELFRDQSDPFCRVLPPPPQPEIKSVSVREDGAVLINGQPRFLSGATHQNQRLTHDLPLIAQLGLMGHRLTQGMTFAQHVEMWDKQKLYSLQMKPGNKLGGTVPVVDLTPDQRREFEEFVKAGGMRNVISVNTGGWEATIDVANADMVAKHAATNDYVRQVSGRPTAISTSGAYNAWWIPKLTWYDINHAETEMWGPMDFNVIFTPYMRRARKTPSTWVYLPQLYDNTPYERYRFETYENIVRGSAGVSMIQGIGDPSFNRGLAGELRYLDGPLNSLEPAGVSVEPQLSHKATRHQGRTYVLATNAGPVKVGDWRWNTEVKHSGRASHEGDSMNQMWVRPGGVRIHGFRGLPMPELIRKGDKIVQYVWIDPQEAPQWAMVCVRGDGRFVHNAVLGKFAWEEFRAGYGNVLMYSEMNHSVWHEINWIMDDDTYRRSVRIMGQAWADGIKKSADSGRATVDKSIYQPEHFRVAGPLPAGGQWQRIELDAEQYGLVGKLVDGFAWLTKNGRALWDYSVLERGGEVVRVFCEDTVGTDRALLGDVRVNVPGLKKGTPVTVLFENRTVTADDGFFRDDFTGVDTYGLEGDGVVGDMFGFVKDEDRELPRMIPSGYGYSYGPTAVHIYEIKP